jgi:hypothetical protein
MLHRKKLEFALLQYKMFVIQILNTTFKTCIPLEKESWPCRMYISCSLEPVEVEIQASNQIVLR